MPARNSLLYRVGLVYVFLVSLDFFLNVTFSEEILENNDRILKNQNYRIFQKNRHK